MAVFLRSVWLSVGGVDGGSVRGVARGGCFALCDRADGITKKGEQKTENKLDRDAGAAVHIIAFEMGHVTAFARTALNRWAPSLESLKRTIMIVFSFAVVLLPTSSSLPAKVVS
ncbi:hypothetical protein OF83DRAFT_57377 [Amylostereum chailletii]|nr:hypothetical protein OF83DRAFT_57377 [Amylostereum chailletii]